MIYQPSKTIQEALRAQNIKCDVLEGPDSSAVITGFDLKSGDQATIHFISLRDTNDAALRVFHFAHVDPAKSADVLPVINRLNYQFRYAKFTLQDDGDVNVEMDIPQETTDLGKVAYELLCRSLDIMAESSAELKAAGAVIQSKEPSPAGDGAAADPQPPAPEAPKKKLFGLFGNGK